MLRMDFSNPTPNQNESKPHQQRPRSDAPRGRPINERNLFVALELVIDIGAWGIGVTDIGPAGRLDGVDFLRAYGCLSRLGSRLRSWVGGTRRRRSRLNNQRPAAQGEHRGYRHKCELTFPIHGLDTSFWITVV